MKGLNMIHCMALGGLLSLGFVSFVPPPAALAQARTSNAAPVAIPADSFDLETCVRLALQANPDLQSRRAALKASRSWVTVARSSRFPSVGLTGSVSRYGSDEGGAMNRRDLGLSFD